MFTSEVLEDQTSLLFNWFSLLALIHYIWRLLLLFEPRKSSFERCQSFSFSVTYNVHLQYRGHLNQPKTHRWLERDALNSPSSPSNLDVKFPVIHVIQLVTKHWNVFRASQLFSLKLLPNWDFPDLGIWKHCNISKIVWVFSVRIAVPRRRYTT